MYRFLAMVSTFGSVCEISVLASILILTVQIESNIFDEIR